MAVIHIFYLLLDNCTRRCNCVQDFEAIVKILLLVGAGFL